MKRIGKYVKEVRWLGHISHANAYHLMERYKEKMLFKDLLDFEEKNP